MDLIEFGNLLPQRPEYLEEHRITTYVVKVASRCNLSCSYCYMYEHADQTWRLQPNKIAIESIRLLGTRLAEYIDATHPKHLLVIAHGGEPLLLGAKGLREFFSVIQDSTKHTSTRVSFGLQTNAILVNDEIVKTLQEFNVRAGVSLDGPKRWNDKNRIDKRGNGTFDRILEGVKKLRYPNQGESVFGGYLTVINPDLSPKDTFAFFEDLDATAVDFLLPDLNHDTYSTYFLNHPKGTFGRWLIEMFDLWFDTRSLIEIRLFKTLIRLILGSKNGFDAIGSSGGGVIVIETDGTYHALDVLKTSYNGSTQTGLSLQTTPLQLLENTPQVIALSSKKYSLCDKCLMCPIVDLCGGGYLPHRYSMKNGFDQESVYCDDLKLFITHVTDRIHAEINRVR